MRTWLAATIIGVVALLLFAMTGLAVLQQRTIEREREELVALREEVADLRAEIERLEATGGRDGGGLDGLFGGLLDDLLGGGGPRGLEDLLDGLGGLGGLGDLEDLLGDPSATAPGAACLVPEGPAGLGDLGALFGGGGIDTGEDVDELVRQVSEDVAALRELEWEREVDVAFLDGDAVRARLDELLAPELEAEELAIDQRLLVTLRALPPDADLAALQLELLGDQVAGFYVSETEELVVRVPADGQLRPVDLVTLAHELDHALTDQVLGLPDRSAPPFDTDPDAAFGALAVVEGDATLLMQRWALANLSITDQLALALDPEAAAAQAALDGIPVVLQRELLAPYTDGLDWVCDRYLEGGWAAVDEAYAAPPTTSAEVLFGTPVDPASTATLTVPPGYEELRTTTFGAAQLEWLLSAPGDNPTAALSDPRGRVRGWGGGTVLVAGRGDDTAVGVALVDTGAGPTSLCTSVTDWWSAAAPEATTGRTSDGTEFDGADQAAIVRCQGDDVRLGVGPDLATARALVR